MMHNVSIAIILSTVIEQYSTEARFYETQLGIDREQWEAWKNGTASLTPAENQKIKLLFSDCRMDADSKNCSSNGDLSRKENKCGS